MQMAGKRDWKPRQGPSGTPHAPFRGGNVMSRFHRPQHDRFMQAGMGDPMKMSTVFLGADTILQVSQGLSLYLCTIL